MPTPAFGRTMLAILFCFLLPLFSAAQTVAGDILNTPVSEKGYTSLSKKAIDIERDLDKATGKYLQKLQKQEAKLKDKVAKIDSLIAKDLFADIEAKYTSLRAPQQKANTYSSLYSAHLDSLATSLSFLKSIGFSSPELKNTLSQYSSLQQKFNETEAVKKFLAERKRLLHEQLESLGMLRDLKGFNKQAYYYSAQLNEYKQLWEDPTKLEKKLLEWVIKSNKFRDFFQENSILGSLFNRSSNYGSTQALVGLQTRSQVLQQISQRLGTASINGQSPQQFMQNQILQAQSQLNDLKAKLNRLGMSNGDGNTDMPDFKPNGQKTKTFLQRLEYGFNLQNQRSNSILPATSDLGGSIGYKLNDNSTAGFGGSYKLGLGKGLQKLQFSNQGVGIRSFIDYRLKGSFWLAGGFEYNYLQAFKNWNALGSISGWQKSGLIGLSKKITVGTGKQASLQLLYDFLANQQRPASQSIKFRIGYSFHK
jgi:hypothetical protein